MTNDRLGSDELAAREPARVTTSAAEAADLQDKYDRMLRLADLFDRSADELRTRAGLGEQILHDDAVTDSAELSKLTYTQAENDLRSATTGKSGLLSRGIELDADALMVRTTVLTYRWIDELQDAAYKTLGSIAGRAIGYLAPEIALGGAVVSAGLIETDALDRDGVAAYLSELAENNPELMDHVTSGGGGLLDGLQMRSVLTVGVMAGETGGLAARGGLRAMGLPPMETDFGSAVRDVAGGFVAQTTLPTPKVGASGAPRNLEELMLTLAESPASVEVRRIGEGRYIAYLPGPGGNGRRLRLVAGDHTAYAGQVVRAIEEAVGDDQGARVLLVGSAQGGVTAAEVAATLTSNVFVIDHVVTAGAPSAHVPRIPDATRVLSLEDRADPVAVLGSLINAGSSNRLTVVFDRGDAGADEVYVVGGRAADNATHPELKAEIQRLQDAGYLSA